ncbi:MAG: hypothetical protein AAB968_03570 [Patescibacteria group bacterium]
MEILLRTCASLFSATIVAIYATALAARKLSRDTRHIRSVEHAARRFPHIAYRMGFIDVDVNQKTKEGILGIWDWRRPSSNKYYTIPLPHEICDLLYDLYERLLIPGKSKVARPFTFTVELPFCNNEHLYKSPLQILCDHCLR